MKKHFPHTKKASKPQKVQKPAIPPAELPSTYENNIFGSLDKLLQFALLDLGYKDPTPIQSGAIPVLMEGRDLIGSAQTGTGKTAAFLLPILSKLLASARKSKPKAPRALVLSPTRELTAQIGECATALSKYTPISLAVVFGGVSQIPQILALHKGADLVIATPGRLLDLLKQGYLILDDVEEFVLDEADRMLDMGFLPDIKEIISRLPKNRHSQFFSATLSRPILALAKTLVSENPFQIAIDPEKPTIEKIKQSVINVAKSEKDKLLIRILEENVRFHKVIVFTRTRHGADRVEKKLGKAKIHAMAIHSDKTQQKRTRALEDFKNGKLRVLVATDIASRGIDIDDVSCVVNIDLPEEAESYIHRIGRTARAGREGDAISLVSEDEAKRLKAIEKLLRKTIPVRTISEI